MTGQLALIVAGGTGGHIFPGLSVAQALLENGWRVCWAGNPDAMEGKLVPKHHIEMYPLVFAGFRGKGLLSQMAMPFRLVRALWQARQILLRNKPTVVLGMGGYVAFPMGLAARFAHIPVVVHEQNSVAGLTNKLLAKVAAQTLVAFPNSLPNAQWVGNPVRSDISSQAAPVARFEGRTGPLKLLVVGGSLGAQALNETVPKALALMAGDKRPEVTHQAGAKHIDALNAHYKTVGVNARVVDFIEDMALEFAKADVVICRAGAMTVSEVAVIGVAALFVPFPHAVDDHQTTNAAFLVREGGGWMRQQKELDADWLSAWLGKLDRTECLRVASRARELAKPEAAKAVVKVIEQVSLK